MRHRGPQVTWPRPLTIGPWIVLGWTSQVLHRRGRSVNVHSAPTMTTRFIITADPHQRLVRPRWRLGYLPSAVLRRGPDDGRRRPVSRLTGQSCQNLGVMSGHNKCPRYLARGRIQQRLHQRDGHRTAARIDHHYPVLESAAIRAQCITILLVLRQPLRGGRRQGWRSQRCQQGRCRRVWVCVGDLTASFPDRSGDQNHPR